MVYRHIDRHSYDTAAHGDPNVTYRLQDTDTLMILTFVSVTRQYTPNFRTDSFPLFLFHHPFIVYMFSLFSARHLDAIKGRNGQRASSAKSARRSVSASCPKWNVGLCGRRRLRTGRNSRAPLTHSRKYKTCLVFITPLLPFVTLVIVAVVVNSDGEPFCISISLSQTTIIPSPYNLLCTHPPLR